MKKLSNDSCGENQHRILMSVIFFRRISCGLWDNAENYGRTGQATDDKTIWRMCFTCWKT